jgi:hypothetical protein
MLKSKLSVSGRLSVVLLDNQGNVKTSRNHENLVVSAGLAYIASRMRDASATAMTHMAVGSGTTAAAAGDTALQTQIGSRVTLTSTTASANTVVYVATFAPGTGTGAITEAGIFNASTAGTMACRTVFPVVNKAAGDTLQITWTITLNAA